MGDLGRAVAGPRPSLDLSTRAAPAANRFDGSRVQPDVVRKAVRVAVLAIEGTNNDGELLVALRALKTRAELVRVNQLENHDVPATYQRRLSDYDVVLIPGGFSGGDYVRAGAIFAARLRASLRSQLEEFVREGRLLGGLCNGFQILTELGLLPGQPDGRLGRPTAALITNDSGRFECRPTYLEWTGGHFPPLQSTPTGTIFMFPSAHSEGKLVLDGGRQRLLELEASGQVLFRWVRPDGGPASYPWNPNGSEGNVGGLTNAAGNVFGLMPHPERHFVHLQAPDWTRSGSAEGPGDGQRFLAAIVNYARESS